MNNGSLAPYINSKRRDKLYIISEILEITKDGTLKTQIMYRANLSFTQLNDYLKFMLGINLLEKVTKDNKPAYKPSTKGLDFLRRYQEITEILKPENVNEEKIKALVVDDSGSVKVRQVNSNK